jgi:hypothetical protein
MAVRDNCNCAPRRLGHGWQLRAVRPVSTTLISRFIRPAVRSIPPAMARQLGPCRVSVVDDLGGPTLVSRWTATDDGLQIELAPAGREEHDVALELLLCLGQALWTKLTSAQERAYWLLLDEELRADTPGEIDEDALQQKRALLSGHFSATSTRRLKRYGAASFAGTAAEYVHCLWHNVTIRSGPDFLPARQLKRRLELLARWYPPAPGYQLFPRE